MQKRSLNPLNQVLENIKKVYSNRPVTSSCENRRGYYSRYIAFACFINHVEEMFLLMARADSNSSFNCFSNSGSLLTDGPLALNAPFFIPNIFSLVSL
jgi:hypothetical protein